MTEGRARRGLAGWAKAILVSHGDVMAEQARLRALKRARPIGPAEAWIFRMVVPGAAIMVTILCLE